MSKRSRVIPAQAVASYPDVYQRLKARAHAQSAGERASDAPDADVLWRAPIDGDAVLYIDFDGFFASVEQQYTPALRGQAVGVVPALSDATSIIAASYQAKRFGVKTGVSVRDAKRMCPDIRLVPARPDMYVHYHHRILDAVQRIVPIEHVRSIDEVTTRLRGYEKEIPSALVDEIKSALRADIGAFITCSIGIAPTELLAKIAADMDKPNGKTILRREMLPQALYGLKLTDLPGVGAAMALRLHRARIHSVEALMALAPKHMRAIWGSVEGERFWAALHGEPYAYPRTQKSMFGHSRVLSWDWRTPERAYACCRLLTIKAARRMRREGFEATEFSVSVRLMTPRNQRYARLASSQRCAASFDDHTFLSILKSMFICFARECPDFQPKKVSIALHGLRSRDAHQRDLFFESCEDDAALRKRWEVLSGLLDAAYDKYRKPVLTLGPHASPREGYAGAKIAFGRIPDLRDF